MVHIIGCFQCPSAVIENGKSQLCFIAHVALFLNCQREYFTKVNIIFLLLVEARDFSLKCPHGLVAVAIPKKKKERNLMVGKNKTKNTVFSRVVLSMWPNGSRMSFDCIEKGI